jgi:DNA-binding GntR family transcriptional regulator
MMGAYSILRSDIIGLRLKPGTIVSIKDLCDHFQISRSPMRDALLRLHQEGLITLLPQRGTMISKIDLARVEEERFLRLSVEKAVMELYLSHCSPDDVTQLESCLQEQKLSVEASDFRKFLALDEEFHDVFYKATGKLFCADIIRKASGHYKRVRLLTCVDTNITQNVLYEHHEMIAAVKSKDTHKLHSIFEHHLCRIDSEEQMLAEKYPHLFIKSNPEEKEDDTLETDFLRTLQE